jgi:WAS protein family, member 3
MGGSTPTRRGILSTVGSVGGGMGRESLPPPPPPPVDMSQPPNPPYISSVMVNPAAPPVNNPPPPPPPPPPMMVQSRDSRESSVESELPLPPPPPIPLDMTVPPPPLDNRAPPPPPPPPPMPMPSSPPDSGRVVANGDINKLPGSSSTPKGSPGKLSLFITGHQQRNSYDSVLVRM